MIMLMMILLKVPSISMSNDNDYDYNYLFLYLSLRGNISCNFYNLKALEETFLEKWNWKWRQTILLNDDVTSPNCDVTGRCNQSGKGTWERIDHHVLQHCNMNGTQEKKSRRGGRARQKKKRKRRERKSGGKKRAFGPKANGHWRACPLAATRPTRRQARVGGYASHSPGPPPLPAPFEGWVLCNSSCNRVKGQGRWVYCRAVGPLMDRARIISWLSLRGVGDGHIFSPDLWEGDELIFSPELKAREDEGSSE